MHRGLEHGHGRPEKEMNVPRRGTTLELIRTSKRSKQQLSSHKVESDAVVG